MVPGKGQLLKGNTSALILSALTEAPLHGYAIARKIEELSGSYFRLNEGSLYPTLHSLERDGAVTAVWEQEGGRRRKRYRITPTGRKMLAELSREWKRFSAAINCVLGGVANA